MRTSKSLKVYQDENAGVAAVLKSKSSISNGSAFPVKPAAATNGGVTPRPAKKGLSSQIGNGRASSKQTDSIAVVQAPSKPTAGAAAPAPRRALGDITNRARGSELKPQQQKSVEAAPLKKQAIVAAKPAEAKLDELPMFDVQLDFTLDDWMDLHPPPLPRSESPDWPQKPAGGACRPGCGHRHSDDERPSDWLTRGDVQPFEDKSRSRSPERMELEPPLLDEVPFAPVCMN